MLPGMGRMEATSDSLLGGAWHRHRKVGAAHYPPCAGRGMSVLHLVGGVDAFRGGWAAMHVSTSECTNDTFAVGDYL
jgi:hypothetical protein